MQFHTFETFSGGNLRMPGQFMKGVTQQSYSQQFVSNQKNIKPSYIRSRQQPSDQDQNSSSQEQSFSANYENSILNQSDDGYLNFKLNIPFQQQQRGNRDIQIGTPIFESKIHQKNKNSNEVSLDRKKISVNLLPQQKVKQSIVLTNRTSLSLQVKVDCPFPIDLINEQTKYKYCGSSQTRQRASKVLINLGAWQSYQLKIELGLKSDDYQGQSQMFAEGDIFETMSIQYRNKQSEDIKQNYKKIYIPISVHFVLPKIKLEFKGNSEILAVCTQSNRVQKVAKIKIQENSFSQYPLTLTLSLSKFYDSGIHQTMKKENEGYAYINKNNKIQKEQKKIDKIDCSLKAYGCVKVFPERISMFDGQACKVMIRKNQYQRGQKEKGVLTIQGEGSNLIFIVGISFV